MAPMLISGHSQSRMPAHHVRPASMRTPRIADRASSAMESRLRELAESSLDGAPLELTYEEAIALAERLEADIDGQ